MTAKIIPCPAARPPAPSPSIWKCPPPPPPGVGGDIHERVEIKEILKMMVPGTANPPKNVKWWCSGTDFFCNLWKWYAPERKFRAENGGLSPSPTHPLLFFSSLRSVRCSERHHSFLFRSSPLFSKQEKLFCINPAKWMETNLKKWKEWLTNWRRW